AEAGGGRGAAVGRAGGPVAGDEGGGEPGGEPMARLGMGTGDGGDARVADELGDLLFAVVNLARLTGVDPAAALSRATAKFEQRFAEVRRLAKERGLPMPGTPLGPLDRLWDEVKERRADRRKP
ncbi:MAG: hypothetical protein OXL34_07405, partial [Gemmatimonadota bacterium]|nr:hypothetical protein [Gemmatimonadota bacterium]